MTSPASDRENLREAIISASLQIGTELGEEGLTMRGLAARLGVSPTALYQYFEGKTAILQEIRARGLSKLLESALAALEAPTPREMMCQACRCYVDFALENPWLYRVLFEGGAPPNFVMTDEQNEQILRLQERLSAGHKELFASLAMQGDDVLPKFLASWWGSLHGVCSLVLGRHITPDNPVVPITDIDAFINDHIEHLVAGLTKRAGV